MILKSGWRGESTFIDPMCGSGTLLIEAAMIALGIPPGIHRQHFAFEKWSDFDEELFSEIYNDDSGARDFQFRIIGSDISPKAIAVAEKNIKNAGLKKYIDLSVKPIQQYSEAPQPPGVLMTNPPYGERIKVDDIETLYATIGERLKHVFVGYDAYILSYRKELFDKIGLKPTKRAFCFSTGHWNAKCANSKFSRASARSMIATNVPKMPFVANVEDGNPSMCHGENLMRISKEKTFRPIGVNVSLLRRRIGPIKD